MITIPVIADVVNSGPATPNQMTFGEWATVVIATLTLLGGFIGWMTYVAMKLGATYSEIKHLADMLATHNSELKNNRVLLSEHGERLTRIETKLA